MVFTRNNAKMTDSAAGKVSAAPKPEVAVAEEKRPRGRPRKQPEMLEVLVKISMADEIGVFVPGEKYTVPKVQALSWVEKNFADLVDVEDLEDA